MKKSFTRFFIAAIALFICIGTTGAVFPSRTIAADYETREVYLGGKPLGIEIGAEGVIVTGISDVITSDGLKSPLKDKGILRGDVLVRIAGRSVSRPGDIKEILDELPVKDVVLTFKRTGGYFDVATEYVCDSFNERKLGINVRDSVTGIGTLTYITADKKFGALGHHITDSETGLTDELRYGFIYNAFIDGVHKSVPDRAGELTGEFSQDNPIGKIRKNNSFGIFGDYTEDINGFQKIRTAAREEVKPGKAYVYTTINGEKPEYYSIDIVKATEQTRPDTKSMVITVTDKRLIEKAGGIVQGMSGSPIIQNGKLVGAVTHVFVGEPTRGFGVYIGWMLQN